MARVLTDLAADIYTAADRVARELVGFIPSSTINANGAQQAAVGDTIRSHKTRKKTVKNNTPSMTIPEGDEDQVDNETMTLTKDRSVEIAWVGEDIRHVNNGSGYETIYGDELEQAFRALTNEIEADLGETIAKGASRAVGVGGTAPFQSDYDLIADARKVLADNGCPINDGNISMVLNTLGGTNLRKLAGLKEADKAGTDRLQRQGTLLDMYGIMLRESAGVYEHASGSTGASFAVNGAHAKDVTDIALDTGTGNIAVGDVVQFASGEKYLVTAGTSGPGTISINDPGLYAALSGGEAVTITNAYTGNVAFHRGALELAMRAPSKPLGGDAAVDVMLVQDPHSGLVFEISAYKGFRKAMFNVGAVWGTKAWNTERVVTVLG